MYIVKEQQFQPQAWQALLISNNFNCQVPEAVVTVN